MYSAQYKQFIYECKFIPDSTNKYNIEKEIMILNIEKGKSEFFGFEKYSSDSTLVADSKKGIFSIPPNKEMINYRIIKTTDSDEIEFVSPLISGNYFVKQEIKLNWDILLDSDTFLNLQIQKAKTNFGGRSWIA